MQDDVCDNVWLGKVENPKEKVDFQHAREDDKQTNMHFHIASASRNPLNAKLLNVLTIDRA